MSGAILNDTTCKVYQFRVGFQYITTLNFSPQFDILNFGNLAKIKSAKANQEIVNHNYLVSKKNLFDQVNTCYHNILSLQAQIKILQQNKQKADSLFKIVSNKNVEGLVRKQDVNDAEINTISINDKIDQANLSLLGKALRNEPIFQNWIIF